ncbi:MAG: NAD(P)-dependent oxidoreductase [Muribaculum sp.]|nr:NAD(P)-dependent oxidoreductase [Muribaculum sp.]
MKTIAVIGSNGFLSNAITSRFINEGWIVNVYGLEEPTNGAFSKFFKTDLIREELNYHELASNDIIVYAAGAGIQSNLKESTDLIFNLNVFVPIKICNQLKKVDYIGTFISFGSVFELGESLEAHVVNEEDILQSLYKAPNEYTVSKRVFSRFVDSYSHSFTHWHFIIPTIYGPGENPKRLIPYTIYSILDSQELNFTSGEQTRQYVFVEEVPSLILLANQSSLPTGIYNIEGSETITVKELVTIIHDKMGVCVPQACFGSAQRADVGMKFLALDGSKLYKSCGFKSKVKIVDVIDKYIAQR